MEMVDMDITRFGFWGPKSRSVNISSALKSWMNFDVDFCYFEEMTFLEMFDVKYLFFDITSQ